MDSGNPMIPMRLSRIVIRDGTDQQWIFLTEIEGERGFAIIIGPGEAVEIRRVVAGIQTERPLTHQLTHMIIDALDARLVGIDIVDLRSNTFFAKLLLRREGSQDQIEVDARPSDALALALRAGSRIRVAQHVLEQARTDMSGPDPIPPLVAGAEPPPDPAAGQDEPGTDEPGPDEPQDPPAGTEEAPDEGE